MRASLLLGAIALAIASTACPSAPLRDGPPDVGTRTSTVDPLRGRFTLEDALVGIEGTGHLVARVETSTGAFTIELAESSAPNTVANFVGLALGKRPFRDPSSGAWVTRPFYEGLSFYRIVPNFVIQGGDPLSVGYGGPGYRIPDEIAPELSHDAPGVVAMANVQGGGGWGGSQFYVTERPTPTLDGTAAIFGHVIEGMETVRRIAHAPRTLAAGSSTVTPEYSERPVTPVKILRISVARSGK
ncbi:MAG: peptidylprolyl isomerase [Myxococcota bacterium]